MRLILTADLHGKTLPALPEGDVLVVAGDLCPDYWVPGQGTTRNSEFQRAWLNSTFAPWAEAWQDAAPGRDCLYTWGNHDFVGTTTRAYANVDEQVVIEGVSFWLTPWSNVFGTWAFMQMPRALAKVYARIPEGIDVLVSHQPPYRCGDRVNRMMEWEEDPHVGSKELRATIARVQPKLVVCGHIHEGFGVYECEGVPVYNVSYVNSHYEPTHVPVVVEV